MKALALITILAEFATADWEETQVRTDPWLTCETDSDCLEGYSCVNFMTVDDYADISSQRGCASDVRCAGTGSWSDGSQYFCNEEQQARADAARQIRFATQVEKVWEEWEPACSEEIPCLDETVCMAMRRVINKQGSDKEWSVGHGCFSEINCEAGYAMRQELRRRGGGERNGQQGGNDREWDSSRGDRSLQEGTHEETGKWRNNRGENNRGENNRGENNRGNNGFDPPY